MDVTSNGAVGRVERTRNGFRKAAERRYALLDLPCHPLNETEPPNGAKE